jgi:hypothetical protein
MRTFRMVAFVALFVTVILFSRSQSMCVLAQDTGQQESLPQPTLTAPNAYSFAVPDLTTATIDIPLDIVLLQDETGSMSDDITILKTLAPQIWDNLAGVSTAGFRMSVVGFRDYARSPWGDSGDWVYRMKQDFTTARSQFVNGVNLLSAGGGNDGPEGQLPALHYMLIPSHACIDSNGDGDCIDSEDTPVGRQPSFRAGVKRIILLATDANFHDPANTTGYPGPNHDTVVNTLRANGVTIIGLVPGGVGTITDVDNLTTATGGSTQNTGSTGQDVVNAIIRAIGTVPVVPSAQGSLSLSVSPAFSTTQAIAPVIARISNAGTATGTYTLTVSLISSGFQIANVMRYATVPGGRSVSINDINFGVRPVGHYRISAYLTGNLIAPVSSSTDLIVADPAALKIILDYSADIQSAAHSELNDIAYISARAFAQKIIDFTLDKLEELATSKFADLAAPIQNAGGIPQSSSSGAIAQIRTEFGRIRGFKDNLSTAIRLFVSDMYGVKLPDGFDPLSIKNFDFAAEPIKKAITEYLAKFIRDKIFNPTWFNVHHKSVDSRQQAFENYLISAPVSEPPGLAVAMQHGRDRILSVVESDAVLTLGPYNVLGKTIRYDLTLKEENNKFSDLDKADLFLKIAIAIMAIVGAVIMVLLIIGVISSGGALAAVVAPIIWKIVNLLVSLSNIVKIASALLVVLMIYTAVTIAPHVPQYQDETLDAAQAMIGVKGTVSLNEFNVAVGPDVAQFKIEIGGPDVGEAEALVETALYSVDGRIINIIWSPIKMSSGQQIDLDKEIPLSPGRYQAVTTLYGSNEVIAIRSAPLMIDNPRIDLAFQLDQSQLSSGQPVRAHVALTNTNPISAVNDLTVIIESSDGVHFNSWPVSLGASSMHQIDYTFVPTATGSYVLRAWAGIGLSPLAQEDKAYVVGSGPAVALNMQVQGVYSPSLSIVLPVTLTNVGASTGSASIILRTIDRLHDNIVYTSTLDTAIPPGSSAAASLTALPNAQPGLYSAHFELNGVNYDSRDFAVMAYDTLFGQLTIPGMYHAVGQTVPVTSKIYNAGNVLTDASTVHVSLASPTGTLISGPMAWQSTGTYRLDFVPPMTGTYWLEMTVEKADIRGVGDRSFIIAGSPTVLIPVVEGQPKVDQITPLAITIRTESGAAVPEATVVLSGTSEYLVDKTDAAGTVSFQVLATNTQPYLLKVDKAGYAGTTTTINVDKVLVYLPLILRNFQATPSDMYEPNDTLAQAYGPLTSGANYLSYLSSNTDLDYYYFDISTLGQVTVDLSNIGAPSSDYDLYLYNSSGQWLGGSTGVTTTEKIEFQPASTGRYYILVYPYSGADPTRPYYLKVQYNGAPGAGDIYGTVYANGSPKSNVPISLNFYDYNTYAYRTVWGMTNSSGQYHFRGMSTLGTNQIYYVYYRGSLGSSYIGYWYSGDLTSYTAGSTRFAGNPDISPLNLGTPNSTTGIPLPITFTWTPRTTSPSETYYVYLYDPNDYSIYYWSSTLGHVGNFTLYGLPSGFTTGHTYRWRVYSYGTDGSGSGSYNTNNVAFSSSGVTIYSAPVPPARIPREQMRPESSKQDVIPARP